MDTDHFAGRIDVSTLRAGTVVAVNADTGECLIAATQEAALAAFEQAFGWGVPARLHVVGGAAARGRAGQPGKTAGQPS